MKKEKNEEKEPKKRRRRKNYRFVKRVLGQNLPTKREEKETREEKGETEEEISIGVVSLATCSG